MEKEIFESDNILQSILKMTIPSILSGIVLIIYNITDIFFVGQTNDKYQVAGVVVSIPISLLIIAISNLFGIGGASLVARLLGKKNYRSIKNVSSFCCYISLLLGFIYNLVVFIFIDEIINLIGATEYSGPYAKDYLLSLSFGAYFLMFGGIFACLIRAEGASKVSSLGIIIGTVANIILDPILILNFNMGALGAGIATIIGNIATAFYYLYYVLKSKKTVLSLNIKQCKIQKKLLYQIITIGFPSALSGFLLTGADVILQNFLKEYGDTIIAGLGIARRIFSLTPIIFISFASGVMPLIAYNFSALKYEKMNKIISLSIKIARNAGLAVLLTFFIFAPFITKLFIDDEAVTNYASKFLRTLCLSTPFMSVYFIFIVFFQGIGKGLPPLILTCTRQFLFFLPVIFILHHFFGFWGVISSLPTVDILISTSAFFLFKNIRANYIQSKKN